MSDGAHIGVSAGRSLRTILGGEEHPKKEDEATREQVRARVMRAPMPGDPSPVDSGADSDSYSLASDSIAKAFLIVSDDDPGLKLEADALWDAMKRRWPEFNEWLGGASGFMVGWATNCVRWLKEKPPAPNPALVTIETSD